MSIMGNLGTNNPLFLRVGKFEKNENVVLICKSRNCKLNCKKAFFDCKYAFETGGSITSHHCLFPPDGIDFPCASERKSYYISNLDKGSTKIAYEFKDDECEIIFI